jgi:hypothetical protein
VCCGMSWGVGWVGKGVGDMSWRGRIEWERDKVMSWTRGGGEEGTKGGGVTYTQKANCPFGENHRTAGSNSQATSITFIPSRPSARSDLTFKHITPKAGSRAPQTPRSKS